MAKYPEDLPVFSNKLRERLGALHYPEIIVGTDPHGVIPGTIEGVRGDNHDRVYYKPSELKPLTRAARELIAWSRQ